MPIGTWPAGFDAALTQNIARLFNAGRFAIDDSGMRMITDEIERRMKTGEIRDARTGKTKFVEPLARETFVDEIKNVFADLSVTVDRKGKKQWSKVSDRQREELERPRLSTLLSRASAY